MLSSLPGGIVAEVAPLLLGGGFIGLAVRLLRNPSRRAALGMYLWSLAYLALLFSAMAADRTILG